MSVKPDSANVKMLPGVAFLILLIAGVAAEILLRLPLPDLPQPFGFFAGMVFVAVATLSVALGAGLFVSKGVNPMPNTPSSHLVTSGIYRLTRNPMYVGAVAMMIGIGLAAGSLWIIAAALPMFLFLNIHVIPREERYLTRTFGEEYTAFCGKVRRWL